MNARLFGWIAVGEWRTYPARFAFSIFAIALGVALGFAVHLINGAALDELASALHSVSGRADVQIVAISPMGFSESLFPKIARLAQVRVASAVIDQTVALADHPGTLEILGIDALKAGAITPALVPKPGEHTPLEALFDADSIFLSATASQGFDAKEGANLVVLVHGKRVPLVVTGTLAGTPAEARLGVMDIGAAQWRLSMLGRLSRIDVRLAPGVTVAAFREGIQSVVPADARLVTPSDQDARTDSLSRAYRVNLDMLALVALFTGAFLVYSTQSLSVSRRLSQGALLRVLGLSRRSLVLQVVSEGAVLGAVGSGLGLLGGLGLASAALFWLGGDLGGGYFPGLHPRLELKPVAAIAFFLLGFSAAVVGSFLPARSAGQVVPAVALKTPGDLGDPRQKPAAGLALSLLGLAMLFSFLPAVAGISVFGYLAMALFLFGGILLMPWLAHITLAPFAKATHIAYPLPLYLALKRLWGAPTQGAVALCGIVAATSLMVAMGIMVTSFRESVDAWVVRLLPAQLYLHVTGPIDSVGLDPSAEKALASVPGVSSIDFLRALPLQLAANRPAVMLIARHIAENGPADTLVLEAARPVPKGAIPVWISEAVVDLYGVGVGQNLVLPLPERNGKLRTVSVFVAGVWRDYARQAGSIVMRDEDYSALTGDDLRSDAGIHTAPGTDLGALEDAIGAVLPEVVRTHVTFSRPRDIRSQSLKIFDRSFAVTYLLEAVAIFIGLLGVAATFSAQTLARAREFGMLRHVGVLRSQILQMLSWEGGLLGTAGVAAGVLLGIAMSQVLIHVVNPQSFHWTMDTHFPWRVLLGVSSLLLLASAGTAVVAGREALSEEAILAVREDW